MTSFAWAAWLMLGMVLGLTIASVAGDVLGWVVRWCMRRAFRSRWALSGKDLDRYGAELGLERYLAEPDVAFRERMRRHIEGAWRW